MTRTRMLYILLPAIVAGGVLASSVTRADDDNDDPWAAHGGDDDANGSLSVATKPPADVYIDGRHVGVTPLKVVLPPGNYKVKLVTKGQGGQKVVIPIIIVPGENMSLSRNMTSGAISTSSSIGGSGAHGDDHARHMADRARQAVDQARQAADQARSQIDQARQRLEENEDIPPQLREKILKRLDKAQKTVDKKLGKLKFDGDWDKFGQDMSEFGAEIGEAFADLEGDFEGLGDHIGKQVEQEVLRELAKKGIRIHVNPNADVDVQVHPRVHVIPPVPPVPPVPPNPFDHGGGFSIDMSDMDVAIDLDDLNLDGNQRRQLKKLIEAEQAAIRPAQAQLDHISGALRDELDGDDVDQGKVDQYVDRMAASEAAIRKARLRAWAESRKLLNDQQRAQIERAGRRRHVGP